MALTEAEQRFLATQQFCAPCGCRVSLLACVSSTDHAAGAVLALDLTATMEH